jgi:hypothetical protein
MPPADTILWVTSDRIIATKEDYSGFTIGNSGTYIVDATSGRPIGWHPHKHLFGLEFSLGPGAEPVKLHGTFVELSDGSCVELSNGVVTRGRRLSRSRLSASGTVAGTNEEAETPTIGVELYGKEGIAPLRSSKVLNSNYVRLRVLRDGLPASEISVRDVLPRECESLSVSVMSDSVLMAGISKQGGTSVIQMRQLSLVSFEISSTASVIFENLVCKSIDDIDKHSMIVRTKTHGEHRFFDVSCGTQHGSPEVVI